MSSKPYYDVTEYTEREIRIGREALLSALNIHQDDQNPWEVVEFRSEGRLNDMSDFTMIIRRKVE